MGAKSFSSSSCDCDRDHHKMAIIQHGSHLESDTVTVDMVSLGSPCSIQLPRQVSLFYTRSIHI